MARRLLRRILRVSVSGTVSCADRKCSSENTAARCHTMQWDLVAKGFEATAIGFELLDPKGTFEKMSKMERRTRGYGFTAALFFKVTS